MFLENGAITVLLDVLLLQIFHIKQTLLIPHQYFETLNFTDIHLNISKTKQKKNQQYFVEN